MILSRGRKGYRAVRKGGIPEPGRRCFDALLSVGCVRSVTGCRSKVQFWIRPADNVPFGGADGGENQHGWFRSIVLIVWMRRRGDAGMAGHRMHDGSKYCGWQQK